MPSILTLTQPGQSLFCVENLRLCVKLWLTSISLVCIFEVCANIQFKSWKIYSKLFTFRPSVSAPQHHQPFLQQNHQERQMSTSNNLYSSDDVANNATYYPDFRSAQVPTNFRPPPSPPLSHKTGVSDK